MHKNNGSHVSVHQPDFQALFEGSPGLYLILGPDLTIVAVTNAYLHATMTRREDILGRGLFDVFPDNPNDPNASGVRNLRASLDRVLQSKTADIMAVQKYDIRRPDSEGGGFEERFWSPINSPLLNADKEIQYIIHRVEDVTEFVWLRLLGHAQDKDSRSLRTRTVEMEAEVGIRTQELEKTNHQLRAANQELAQREVEQRQVEEELRKINGFLNSIVENIPDMIFVKEAKDLCFERFNSAGEQLLGYPRESLLGKNDYDFFPAEQAKFFIAKDREVLAHKKLLDIPEEIIQTKQGLRTLHTKKIPLCDEHGHPKYLLGISEDITDRKRTEQELRMLNEDLERRVAERTAAAEERARELAQSNADLERFAYIASHDLQEPLRTVTSYVQLLERRYHDKLDQDAHEFIQFAVDGVARMKNLINGLLQYARIGKTEKPLQVTSAGAVLDQVLFTLQIALQEKKAKVRYGHLPKVMSEPVLLAEVFQNLIGNALKFCTAPHPDILVDAKSGDGEWVFEVRDNGMGIDPKHATRIFEIFQRLHPVQKYPGTGLGLAICKRVIERQGGRIWVESQLGQGSTFYFSLKAA